MKNKQKEIWKHNAVHSHRIQKREKERKAIHIEQTKEKKETSNMHVVDETKRKLIKLRLIVSMSAPTNICFIYHC